MSDFFNDRICPVSHHCHLKWDVDTSEYSTVDLANLDNVIPQIDEFDPTKKNLLNIEDIDYRNMPKSQFLIDIWEQIVPIRTFPL